MFRLFQIMRQKLVAKGRFSNYVTYAIGEIILVVVGILIALGNNHWNHDRKDRIREQMYLNSFKTDLQKYQIKLQWVYDKTRVVKNSCQMLLDIGRDSIPMLPPKKFDSLVNTTFGYTLAITNEGTLNDIKQSGDLNVIQNDTLRRRMASWEVGYKRIREREGLLKEAFNEHRLFMKTVSDLSQRRGLDLVLTPKNRIRITNDIIGRYNLGNMVLNTTVLNRLHKQKIQELDTLIMLVNKEIDN